MPLASSSRPAAWRGLACQVIASLLFSLMNVCVYAIGRCEPELPPPVVSFIRILLNITIVSLPALLGGRFLDLFGDRRATLWLRGLFGNTAMMMSYASIQLIGPGESAFLGASSGVFVALLGPLVLRQKNSPLVWLAILGAMLGTGLLSQPRFEAQDFLGRALGLGTGLLSALAYMMVTKAGRSNSTESVVFYFCLVGLLMHLAWFSLFGLRWPQSVDVWLLLFVGGAAASGAQFYLTRAYQIAPAALVSAVAYLSPVLSLVWGVALFGLTPDLEGWTGCALVLVFGVMLPFLSVRRR